MLSQPLLYVEDEPSDVMLMEIASRRAQLSNPLKTVGDGHEATNYLSGEGCYQNRQTYPFPCLMLLDLNLPQVHGFEVVRWIRGNVGTKNLPVIVWTSSDRPQDINTPYDLGATGYLIKAASLAIWVDRLKAIREFWLVHNTPPALNGGQPA